MRLTGCTLCSAFLVSNCIAVQTMYSRYCNDDSSQFLAMAINCLGCKYANGLMVDTSCTFLLALKLHLDHHFEWDHSPVYCDLYLYLCKYVPMVNLSSYTLSITPSQSVYKPQENVLEFNLNPKTFLSLCLWNLLIFSTSVFVPRTILIPILYPTFSSHLEKWNATLSLFELNWWWVK